MQPAEPHEYTGVAPVVMVHVVDDSTPPWGHVMEFAAKTHVTETVSTVKEVTDQVAEGHTAAFDRSTVEDQQPAVIVLVLMLQTRATRRKGWERAGCKHTEDGHPDVGIC